VNIFQAYKNNLRFIPSFTSFLFNRSFFIRKAIFDFGRELGHSLEGKILDFGVGSAPYKHLFRICDEYMGLDFQADVILRFSRDVDIYYDGQKIPLQDEVIDHVISFETLEHVPNLDTILIEINRVLKIGGTFNFSVPFLFPVHEQPADYNRLTNYGWEKILERNKFSVLKNRPALSSFSSIAVLNLRNITETNEYIFKKLAPIINLPFIIFFNLIILIFSPIMPQLEGWESTRFIQCVKIADTTIKNDFQIN
jgi:SAM-dependent methyltransferase